MKERREVWSVIRSGTKVEMGVPEVYPAGTSLPMVLAQPFARRIRRFVAARPPGGWVVQIAHSCNTVLCTCKPRLKYERAV